MENIDSIIKDISYKPKDYAEACTRLKHHIKKALSFIPGYFENIRIIKALNTCLINIGKIENQLLDPEIEKEFNSIQTYIVENLPKVRRN